MKKTLLLCIIICTFLKSFSQNDYVKRPILGAHFILNDFNTAATLRTGSLSKVIQSNQWSQANLMVAGLGISYTQGLSNNIDFSSSLSASFVDYPVPNKSLTGNSNLLLEGVATGNLKLLSDKFLISPFLTAGVGASKYKGYYAAIMPMGVGLQINLFDEAFILINSQYRVPITANATYHFYHSIGIAGNIGKGKSKAVEPTAPGL